MKERVKNVLNYKKTDGLDQHRCGYCGSGGNHLLCV